MASRSEFKTGFSLLEVIIATAALAGSAMVLISLIGIGTRFGSKAEQRTIALSAAQSVLDEFLIETPGYDSSADITGNIEGRWPMSYRLTIATPHTTSNSSGAIKVSGLARITVEVFESEQAMNSGSAAAICRLSRFARLGASSTARNTESSLSSLRQERLE